MIWCVSSAYSSYIGLLFSVNRKWSAFWICSRLPIETIHQLIQTYRVQVISLIGEKHLWLAFRDLPIVDRNATSQNLWISWWLRPKCFEWADTAWTELGRCECMNFGPQQIHSNKSLLNTQFHRNDYRHTVEDVYYLQKNVESIKIQGVSLGLRYKWQIPTIFQNGSCTALVPWHPKNLYASLAATKWSMGRS